ncbi:MAG: ABC transporter substrate-binding protein [Deltaproteobacteria bacterium]|nr:ABC transporter substrate-binding protein [Deltaproteobacteria bacterium]
MKKKLIITLLFLVALMMNCSTAVSTEKATRVIMDMAGREVTVPAKIDRVFFTNLMAGVLTYTIDPDLIIAWNGRMSLVKYEYLLPEICNLPVLGSMYPEYSCNTEELLQLRPDVILCMEYINTTLSSKADEIQKRTGIPVIVLSGKLEDSSDVYDFVGKLLNRENQTSKLSAYCRETLMDIQTKSKIIPEDQRFRVYYAEGAKGLQTDPSGSSHSQFIDFIGAINVAKVPVQSGMGMTSVSMEHLLSWDPDVIIAWGKTQGGYFDTIMTDPKWAKLSAVKNKKVYALPTGPFNWADRPHGVNRMIGLRWMGNLIYPEVYKYDIEKEAREFYKLFYHYDISKEELAGLLKNSGGI